MFALYKATTGGASVPDLSTWKSQIDALQPRKPSLHLCKSVRY
ncbi:MAG: hypothetical protein CM15mV51_1620 [uncultured marine virus]|nr:MAG: hypothetical protein CM15mV51_1620 [uncultured marine virus]